MMDTLGRKKKIMIYPYGKPHKSMKALPQKTFYEEKHKTEKFPIKNLRESEGFCKTRGTNEKNILFSLINSS